MKDATPFAPTLIGPASTVLPSLKVTVPCAFTGRLLDEFVTSAEIVAVCPTAEGEGVTETAVVVAGSLDVPIVRHHPLPIWRVPGVLELDELIA